MELSSTQSGLTKNLTDALFAVACCLSDNMTLGISDALCNYSFRILAAMFVTSEAIYLRDPTLPELGASC